MKFEFSEYEIEKLKEAYEDLQKAQLHGRRVTGEHYVIVNLLKSFGCNPDFWGSSSKVEDFIEYAITYGKAPEDFDEKK